MTGKFVRAGDDVAGDGQTSFELEDLPVDLIGLNDGVLDAVEDGVDVNVFQEARNLPK